ncbi:uncharacterized protein LOC118078661 isoform X5 [Zootoca vivipara]|uniref:uncharacterized protein LOC118078661 isoform X5 n=1 Tax=Zootoca vivipara TaxID=8524 RepID=UPI00293BC5C7|nr:uncharacterized protein LOC118078661 isoform X5 [Zootoca vivipara]
MNFVSRSLVILLSFGPWILSSLETLSHEVGNPTLQVKGILQGSVLFFAYGSEGITVEKMEWDFLPQRGGLGFWLGEFRHGKLQHPSPTDRFGQRLDMVDETTLRIKDLELDDGGIYNARIWFAKSLFQEQSFSLIVYEPVPTPKIDHQVESMTPGGCNVTLRCHTPGREELNISWETGGLHRALGKSVNQFQVSDHGRELRVFYWNSYFDSKFTCQASNPVDKKGASFDFLNICQSDEGGHLRLSSWNPWLIPSVTILLVTMVMVMVIVMLNWMCWKIRLERNGRETLSHEVGNPTLQVKGILGGSVLFFANGSEGIAVEKMEWDFLPQRGGLGFWLGEFRHGKLQHPSPLTGLDNG